MGNVVKLKSKKKISIKSVLVLLAAAAAAAGLAYINLNNPDFAPKSSSGVEALSLDSSVTYKFKKAGSGIVICGSDALMGVNGGGETWKAELDGKNHIISSAGKYVLAAETDGRRLTLFEGGKAVGKIEVSDDIITARVNRAGRIAVATKEKGYRAQVIVFTPEGKQIYVWHSATYYVLDLALNDRSDRLAVAGLNSDNASEVSAILLFSLNSADYITVNAGNDNLVTSIEYIDDGVLAVGDSEALYVKKSGELAWNVPFHGRLLQNYNVTEGGNLVLALTKGSMEGYFGGSDVEIYGKNGKLRGEFETSGPIKFVDSDGEKILVDTSTGAAIINNRGSLLENVTFDKTPRESFLIDDGRKIIIIAGSSVEIMDL